MFARTRKVELEAENIFFWSRGGSILPYFPGYGILFIHIPKNAGKSIENALGGNSASIRRLGQRNLVNRASTLLQRLTGSREARRRLHGSIDYTLCSQHLTFQQISSLGLLGFPEYEGMKSFAVFRDPFARAVSSYYHFYGDGATRRGFSEFLAEWYNAPSRDHNVLAHKLTQVDFVLDCRGRVAVDRILLFDDLEREFSQLCLDWGLGDLPLPHTEIQGRRPPVEYFFGNRERVLMEEKFGEDIEFYRALVETRKNSRV